MTIGRQIAFWVGVLAVFVAFLLVFSAVLLPFVAGMVLAYALDPAADWFERRGMGRGAATMTIVVLFVILLVVVLVVVLPILIDQLFDLIEQLPIYATRLQSLFTSLLDSRLFRFLGIDSETIRTSMSGFTGQGATWIATVLSSLWVGGQAVIAVFSLIVVTPVVAFYLLYDWGRMIARIDGLLPRDYAGEIRRITHDIDRTIAAFIRGQGLTCLILALFYGFGLGIIGLNSGFLIGISAGLLSFIPFVGSTLGFLVSGIVALVQFWPEWQLIAATVGIFIAGQVLEGYFLQPQLIGQNVGLHPVWVMFALFAFGLLFGFLGLMIAIPAAAAVGVLVRYGVKRYLASPLYRGTGTASGEP
jgi:predicted PurR-regulated permease PerM